MDAFETDYPNGKIDLIGNNLVTTDTLLDSGITSVNFLSYNEKLVETISLSNVILDRPGNVIALDYNGSFSNVLSNTDRTDTYAEETISGVTRATFTWSSSTTLVEFSVDGTNPNNGSTPYVIIGGSKINIDSTTASFNINANDYGSFSSTASYYSVFKVDTTGTISKVSSSTALAQPSVGATDVVLGYTLVTIAGGSIKSAVHTDVCIGTSGYLDLQLGIDYFISVPEDDTNTFVLSFTGSAGSISTSNYLGYRKLRRFNEIRNVFESTTSEKAAILMNFSDGRGYVKQSLAGFDVSSVTATSQNKSISVSTYLGMTRLDFKYAVAILGQAFVLYPTDDELIFSDYKMVTTDLLPGGNLIGTSSYGIVSKYSSLYKDLTIKYYDNLENPDIRKKIEYLHK